MAGLNRRQARKPPPMIKRPLIVTLRNGSPHANRARLWTGVGVLAIAVYAVLLWLGPSQLDASVLHGLNADQKATAIDDFRGRMLQFGAGAVAVAALVFTARDYVLSREGHLTDRYTKAIEQLGSDQRDVRLGAIYALERIMVDSVRDHPTIVEVLAAFIREHSPWMPRED